MGTTIAQHIAGVLAKHNIERFFTIPGSSCISMNDALNNRGVTPVLCRSEESATHAAHGYAATTESFGCAVVSRGPGATNTITGLVTACEGYPVLVIIGDNASTVRQKNIATQDLPLERIFDGVCDYATIASTDDAQNAIDEVLHKLTIEKKSCVLIVPSDLWNKEATFEDALAPAITQAHTPDMPLFKKHLQAFPQTDKNILLLGSGILNNPELRSIAEKALRQYNAPFIVSTRGIGYPLPQRTGWMGILSEPDTNELVYSSEHIVILDECLETATTGVISEFQKGRTITNIAITTNDQYNFTPDNNVCIQPNDFAAFLDLLLQQTTFMSKVVAPNDHTPTPEIILEHILHKLPESYNVCLDSGQNFFWGAHTLVRVNKHRIIYSYTQATMGFGLPALVGVSSINPGGSLLICGDGGFLMASEELASMYSAGFKGKIIILNNNMLGMIYQTQQIKALPRLAVDIEVHNLQKIVEGYGWEYISITDIDDAAIDTFLKSDNNCVLNIQLDQNESVYPRGSTSERLPTV